MKTKALLLTACTLLATVQATAQKRAERLSLENPESFSMILMGDPQSYVKYDINQPVFELTTAWTADNIENLKIKAVLVTGDLVETNDNAVPVRSMANQTSRQMWESVSRSFERLDNKVPYIISPGNHDYGYRSAENGRTCFPEYFPVERNNKWNDALVALYPNRNGDQSLENAAFEFSDKNWGKLLVISSEFAPRDEVLEWAKNLCTSDKYKNHRVIFLTHSYLKGGAKAERIVSEGYKITPRNWGQAIWDKLNFMNTGFSVFCPETSPVLSYQKNGRIQIPTALPVCPQVDFLAGIAPGQPRILSIRRTIVGSIAQACLLYQSLIVCFFFHAHRSRGLG